jgi:hypothetical protein
VKYAYIETSNRRRSLAGASLLFGLSFRDFFNNPPLKPASLVQPSLIFPVPCACCSCAPCQKTALHERAAH